MLSSCVTALVGVGFVVVHTYKGQMNAQIFTSLNQRFNLEAVLPPESNEMTLAALCNLNLCSEGYCLYRRREVWLMDVGRRAGAGCAARCFGASGSG